MIKKKFLPTLGIFLSLPLVLAACLPSIGSSDKSEGSPSYVQGRVVSNFPQIPIFEGASVVESYGYKVAFGASFISPDSLKEVGEFYNRSLGKAGWETKVETNQTGYIYEIKNDKYQGEIIINTAADGKDTAITIAVSQR